MKILLIGGTRFLGRHIVEKLKETEHDVTLLNLGKEIGLFPDISTLVMDRKNKEGMERVLKERSFDIIIDTCCYQEEDIGIATSTLKNIHQYIMISSAAIYSRPPISYPFTESHEKCLKAENGEYGYGKLLAENKLIERAKEMGFNYTIIRPTYLFGPYDYNDYIWYIFRHLSSGEPIRLRNDGNNILQFDYVKDLAINISKLIGNKNAYDCDLNLSSNTLLTLNQMIDLISSIININGTIIHNVGNTTGHLSLPSFHYFVDNLKASRILNMKPKYGFTKGIAESFSWWKNK